MARETRLHSFGTTPEAALPAAKAPEAQPSTEPDALTVTQALARAKKVLGDDEVLRGAWVRGEISGFKAWSSGHWYFDVKDERSVLRCMMWSSDTRAVRFQPEDGMEILLHGRMDVYAQKGDMRFMADQMRPVGAGALALAFEQLKRKLDAEGVFSAARKRPVPRHPRRIGVVTSLQGAVLRDIVRTATRRHPAARLLVVGSRVQGEGAADEVARAIERLDRGGQCDVIIVARGGGSLEDLWTFNEERVVRAVVASATPVVSAVGHETDFTLCDFAADLRASTPTAAAELLAPSSVEILTRIDDRSERLTRALRQLVPDLHEALDDRLARAESAIRTRIGREKELMAKRFEHLDALSPLGVLARGYAVVQREGKVVRDAGDLPVGSEIDITLHRGRVSARVTKTTRGPHVKEG